jgi:hypothetical protein
VDLVPCGTCDEEGGLPDGDGCETCAGSGIDSATVEVVKTVQRVAGELRFVPPKADNSVRTVAPPDLCITALCEHKIRQQAERETAGKDWRDNGLVFHFRFGAPMEPDNLRRSRGRVRARAGLADVRFHEIRHTCVSLLDLGVPPHVVRDIASSPGPRRLSGTSAACGLACLQCSLTTLSRCGASVGRRYSSNG